MAGRKDAALQLVPRILETARKLELDYQIRLTEYAGHAGDMAREYTQKGEAVRLYTCGGDGTFHEVIQQAAGNPHLSVGCIPCGSGNDYVRNFASRSRFLDLRDQMMGREVTLDLMETAYGLAVTICSVGLDAQVAHGIGRWRRVPGCGGSMSYLLSAAKEISGPLGHRMRVTLDQEIIEDNFLMMALCNGKAYGGGFFAAPNASMEDGQLDVVLVNKISRLQMLPVLGAYRKGNHLNGDQVTPAFRKFLRYRKARHVEIQALDPKKEFVFTIDGECFKETHLEVKVLPGMLRAVLPASVYEEWRAAERGQGTPTKEPSRI